LTKLGPGESGKSTITKQIKLLHSCGFTAEEKLQYRPIIFANVISAVKGLMDAMDNYGLRLALADNKAYKKMVQGITEVEMNHIPSMFPLQLANAIKMLWRDEGVLECFKYPLKSCILDCSHL
jgi:guanine nucleotide-binding protein subunit alpha